MTATAESKLTPSHTPPATASSGKWEQVKKKKSHSPASGNPALPTSPTLGKTTNRCTALDTVELEPFQDDPFIPIATQSAKEDYRALYKHKRGQNALSTPLTGSLVYKQEMCHPAHMLKHITPARGQWLLTTEKPEAAAARNKLRDQIAVKRLLRSRQNPSSLQLPTSKDDTAFLSVVQRCLGNTPTPERSLTKSSPISVALSTIATHDEVANAKETAIVDMMTRFYLPHLYHLEPGSKWQNVELVPQEGGLDCTISLTKAMLTEFHTLPVLSAV